MDIFSTGFNPSWTRLRGWSWGFLSSTAFLLPSATNFTGCRSRNASGSKSLSSYVIVSLVRRLSIWQNSVVQWVHPLVGSVYALPHVVISLFRDSDFEDLATGLLLSLGPHVWNSLPTEIRQSCNNLLQFKSKLKTFLFQQSWALLWNPYLMRGLTNTHYYYYYYFSKINLKRTFFNCNSVTSASADPRHEWRFNKCPITLHCCPSLPSLFLLYPVPSPAPSQPSPNYLGDTESPTNREWSHTIKVWSRIPQKTFCSICHSNKLALINGLK